MSSDHWLIVGSLILLNGLANASIKMYLLLSLKLQILLFSLRYSLFISFPNGSLLTKFIENFYSSSLFSYLFENLFLFLLKLSPDTCMSLLLWVAWLSNLVHQGCERHEDLICFKATYRQKKVAVGAGVTLVPRVQTNRIPGDFSPISDLEYTLDGLSPPPWLPLRPWSKKWLSHKENLCTPKVKMWKGWLGRLCQVSSSHDLRLNER